MNIQILGWYGHGNIGDEAYKVAFPILFPDDTITFIEKVDPADRPDLLILGGGDIAYPAFTRQAVDSGFDVVAHSISLTENSDFDSLAEFDRVCVRDAYSVELAGERGLDVVYEPDVTFLLTPDPVAGRALLTQTFAEEGHDLRDRVVACVVSNYLANAKLDMLARDLTTFLKVSQDIAVVADQTDASFVFLPFSTKAPWDDRVSCGWVGDRCKSYQKNLVLWGRLTVQETLDVVAASHLCVSSRLHSTIFSVLSGISFIDLTHHTKNIGFLQTVGRMAWSLPFWEFSVAHYKALLDGASSPDANLQAFTAQAKEALRNSVIK